MRHGIKEIPVVIHQRVLGIDLSRSSNFSRGVSAEYFALYLRPNSGLTIRKPKRTYTSLQRKTGASLDCPKDAADPEERPICIASLNAPKQKKT